MRRLIRGDFQPVLEQAFLAEVRQLHAADPFGRVVVVVPSNLLKLHLRRLLATTGTDHLNVRFVTLIDLARELGRPALIASGRRLLPALGRGLLAREVARSCPDDSYFARVRAFAGFPRVLAATLRDVRDCLISPDDLRRASRSRKVRDFADLLADYERRLSETATADDADLFRVAIEAAPTHDFFDLPSPLLVYGFYDFTSVQRRLLEAAIVRTNCVVFTPIGSGTAFSYAKPTLAFLERLGFVEDPPASASDSGQGALNILTRRLFESPADSAPAEDDGSVTILACPTASREAQEVVRVVRDLAADGVPIHEIGVVFRGGEGASLLDEAFRAFALDADLKAEQCPALFRHGGRPLTELRAARAFLLLLELLSSGLRRRDLFEWLHHAGGESRATVFEQLARQALIVGGHGREEWEDRLERLATGIAVARERAGRLRDRESQDGETHIPEDRRFEQQLEDTAALCRLVITLSEAADRLRAADTFAEQVTLAVELFDRWSGGRPDESTAVREALRAVADLDGLGATPDPETLARLATEAFESDHVKEGRFQQGLFAGTILPARGIPFRALILPGLLDGVFPRRGRPDPILLDHERAELSRALLPEGDVGLPLANRAADEDRMLFRLACGAASERLVLSRPRFEAADGKELIPSSALVAAGEALAGRRITTAGLDTLPMTRTVPAFGLSTGVRALDLTEFDRLEVQHAVAAGSANRLLFLTELYPPLAHVISAEQARWADSEFTAWDGIVPGHRRKGSDRSTQATFSPSRLERYARCPFSYFASTVLGVHELDDPGELLELSALDRGSLVHSILEEFGTTLAREATIPVPDERRPALRDELLALAARQLEEFEASGGLVHPLAWHAERRRLLEDLTAFLDYEFDASTGRRPTMFEEPFGGKSGRKPLRLDVAGTELLLSGKIDRIDLAEKGGPATVIDYKTGKPASKWDGRLHGGRNIQLPLYALAVQQVVRPGVLVDRSEYFFCTVKGRGKRLPSLRDEWQKGPGKELKRVLGGILNGISSGVFLADPRDDGTCRFCEVRLACGKGAGLDERFERKRRDGKAKAYFDLAPAEQPS